MTEADSFEQLTKKVRGLHLGEENVDPLKEILQLAGTSYEKFDRQDKENFGMNPYIQKFLGMGGNSFDDSAIFQTPMGAEEIEQQFD